MKGKIDFFLVGYPKSGTTAIYYYLSKHPGVFLPKLKEPHYFTEDFPGARIVNTQIEYENLYKDSLPNQLKGDASASVIHSDVALENILKYEPSAKFIVILRNPIAAVKSFHSELLYNFTEDVEDFEKAWYLQDRRSLGYDIPFTCKEPAFLQYSKIYNYRHQLPKFFNLIPKDRRLILIFEEFFADPRNNYIEVLNFLGLEYNNEINFEVINSAKEIRYRWLSSFHRRLVESNGYIYQGLKIIFNSIGLHPSNLLKHFNLKKAQKKEISEDFQDYLLNYYQLDIEKVEELLGCSIDAWKG